MGTAGGDKAKRVRAVFCDLMNLPRGKYVPASMADGGDGDAGSRQLLSRLLELGHHGPARAAPRRVERHEVRLIAAHDL